MSKSRSKTREIILRHDALMINKTTPATDLIIKELKHAFCEIRKLRNKGYVMVGTPVFIYSGSRKKVAIKYTFELLKNEPIIRLSSTTPVTQDSSQIQIEELVETIRTYNCLKSAGKFAAEDLVNMSDKELLRLRGFGKKSLFEVKNGLAKFGLTTRREN